MSLSAVRAYNAADPNAMYDVQRVLLSSGSSGSFQVCEKDGLRASQFAAFVAISARVPLHSAPVSGAVRSNIQQMEVPLRSATSQL